MKRKKFARLMSLVMAASMSFTMVPTTAFATNVADTEVVSEAEDTEEAVETEEASEDAQVSTASSEAASTESDVTADLDTSAITFSLDDTEISVQAENVDGDVVGETEVDEDDPVIEVVADELSDIEVLDESDETGTRTIALTEEQQATVLSMFQSYLDFWYDHADVLGVQLPFYLQYNDNEDSLGVLGEMLCLAGVSVDDVRDGNYSYSDLTGMIMNFIYGDQLAVQYYEEDIRSMRDQALKAVEDSGAQTEEQKLLVLNDWLATVNSFDMSYIMNSGKEEPTMIAQDAQKHEHYDDIYAVLYQAYEPQITQMFHDQVFAAVEADMQVKYYQAAVQNIVSQQAIAGYYANLGITAEEADEEQKAAAEAYGSEQAESYLAANADQISADPDAFARSNFGDDAADQLAAGCAQFITSAETDGVDYNGYTMTVEQITQSTLNSEEVQVDLDGDGNKDVTFNQAIAIYTDQAAVGLTDGVLGYWEGNHVGAFTTGKTVCMGYTKAYAYLVQCMHPEIYLKDGATDIDVASNWKKPSELYYDENGNLDIDAGYVVDAVRITFSASVSMYGETQPDFNSDHFWNAVKVNGKWYYVDTTYNDVYTEVMIRDRVEMDGYMNHLYFLASHTTIAELFDGNFSALSTLYADAATDKSYEDSWVSRIKSNVYADDDYFYYTYDSTDIVTLLEKYNNMSFSDIDSLDDMGDSDIKIVRHAKSANDAGDDGDTNYETLIDFTYLVDEDTEETVVKVLNPETGELEDNEFLTELYALHEEQAEVYPNIGITTVYSDGKVYFNLSTCILSYDLETGDIAVEKQYGTVYTKRDLTNAFSATGFDLVTSADNADFTFENHPIAGIALKQDGKLYVDIATNLAYISGKDDGTRNTETDYTADSAANGYGYEFEETNYNPDYSSYSSKNSEYDSMKEMFGYEDETNDNDEFMWVANINDSFPITDLVSAEDVEYESIEHEHHYLLHEEQYFTKDDNGNWNTGEVYVCTICGKHVEEPTEPSDSSFHTVTDAERAEYEEELAEYNYAVENAGHTYTATDAVWADDYSSVTFTSIACSVCEDVKDQLDLLVEDDTVSYTLSETATLARTSRVKSEDKTKITYTAEGEVEGHAVSVSITVDAPDHVHAYGEPEWTWADDYSTAQAAFTCDNGEEDEVHTETADAAVVASEDDDYYIYTATVEFNGETFTDEQKVKKHKHAWSEPEFKWSDDHTTAKATFTCDNGEDETHTETVDAAVTVEETDEGADGMYVYTAAVEFNGETYTDVQKVDKEHVHAWGEPTFTWSSNNKTASAVFVCEKNDEHTEEVEAEVESVREDGYYIYTATVEFEGETYTDSKKVNFEAPSVSYSTHVENVGWQKAVADGEMSGTSGQSLRLEGIKINVNSTEYEGGIEYRTHIQNVGWQEWKADGELSGTTGQSLRLEAIKIRLTGELADKYDVYYRVHAQNFGWLGWAKNGEPAGSGGYSYRLEGIEIVLVAKDDEDSIPTSSAKAYKRTQLVSYTTHVQNVGWQSEVMDGAMSGTSGQSLRLEGIKIRLLNQDYSGNIEYSTHVQNVGWQNYVKNGAMSGTSGQSLRLEGIKIRLTGEMAEHYDVVYRVHVQNVGWTKWVKNGEMAGTEGQSLRLEGIEIKLVEKD